MIHFGEQKGPFREVKWAILKNDLDFSSVLYELFTDSRAFGLKKRAKNSAEFYGNFYLLPHPFSDKTVHEFPPTSASVSRQDAPATFHFGTQKCRQYGWSATYIYKSKTLFDIRLICHDDAKKVEKQTFFLFINFFWADVWQFVIFFLYLRTIKVPHLIFS